TLDGEVVVPLGFVCDALGLDAGALAAAVRARLKGQAQELVGPAPATPIAWASLPVARSAKLRLTARFGTGAYGGLDDDSESSCRIGCGRACGGCLCRRRQRGTGALRLEAMRGRDHRRMRQLVGSELQGLQGVSSRPVQD